MGDLFSEIYDECRKLTDKLYEVAGYDKEMQKKAIAQKIKHYRIFHSLTQAELAKTLGVTKMEILRWEQEKNLPSQLANEKLKQAGIV
jgi:DNA-binding XRE family transcriptional regulator